MLGQRSPIIGRESDGGSVRGPHGRALSERGELNPSPMARLPETSCFGEGLEVDSRRKHWLYQRTAGNRSFLCPVIGKGIFEKEK